MNQQGQQVCRFFQRGQCRYGDRCRFSHITENKAAGPQPGIIAPSVFGGTSSHGHANATPQKAETLQALENTVMEDMANWINAPTMWLLSSYGPAAPTGCLPFFEDLSFEELRMDYYTNRTVRPEIMQKYAHVVRKRQELSQPNQECRQILQQKLGMQTQGGFQTSSVFGQQQQPQANAASMLPQPTATPLMSMNQPQQVPVNMPFGQQSIFGGQNQSQPVQQPPAGLFSSNPIFGGAQQQQQPNPFNSQSMPMGSNQFTPVPSGLFTPQPGLPQQQQQQQPSGFDGMQQQSQSQQVPQHVFGGQQQQQPLPPQHVFGGQQQQPPPQYGFDGQQSQGPPQHLFGGQGQLAESDDTPTFLLGGGTVKLDDYVIPWNNPLFKSLVYSKEEDLDEDEIAAFEAEKFTVDTLPLKAPAERFCK